jgi:protein SCO1/2
MPSQIRFGLVVAIAAALGLALGVFMLKPKVMSIASGTLLQPPRDLPAFVLTGDNGQPYTNQNWQGHWTIVFAGFTTCPDVCPTTLTLMKGVFADLGPLASKAQMLMLSVDPERDTPEKLAQYVHYFSPTFTGATGSNAELDKLARAMSFVYEKIPGATPSTYTMDHSAALMLVNPKGQLAGFFTAPHQRAALVADLKTILESAGI